MRIAHVVQAVKEADKIVLIVGERGCVLDPGVSRRHRRDRAGRRTCSAAGRPERRAAFGPDLARVPAEANRLDNQVLVHYYEAEWRRLE